MLAITVTGTNNLVFTGDGVGGPDSLQIQISQQTTGGTMVAYTGTGGLTGSATNVTGIAFNATGMGNAIEIDDITGSVSAQGTFTVDEANAADQIDYNDGFDPAIATTLKNVQIVHVFDNSSPIAPETAAGGDVFAVKSTLATITDTTVGSTSGFGGNFIDVSSDAPVFGRFTSDNGNLAGIKGALTIDTGANLNPNFGVFPNLVVISDVTGTTAKTVAMTGTSITGFAPATINYAESMAGTMRMVLVGSSTQATTFNVSGTCGPGNANVFPSLVQFFGGDGAGNTFNIQGAYRQISFISRRETARAIRSTFRPTPQPTLEI